MVSPLAQGYLVGLNAADEVNDGHVPPGGAAGPAEQSHVGASENVVLARLGLQARVVD